MSHGTSSNGSAWNSLAVHSRGSATMPSIRKPHSSGSMCGVGPAVRTGKPSSTYCPGGTRSASSSGTRRRPENPREKKELMCSGHRIGFAAAAHPFRSLSGFSSPRRDDWTVRVLVVEDDVRMAAAIRRGLRYEGLVVDIALDGEQALRGVQSVEYDAVVLDVMLSGADGFETCRRLRADGRWLPVLMLTARDAVEDRVRGLDGGADDYMTKPFSLAELVARLRALVRRGAHERPAVLEVGDLRLDPATREVHRGDVAVKLSAREFALLETF